MLKHSNKKSRLRSHSEAILIRDSRSEIDENGALSESPRPLVILIDKGN